MSPELGVDVVLQEARSSLDEDSQETECLIQGDLVRTSLEPQDLLTGIWPPPAPAASVM